MTRSSVAGHHVLEYIRRALRWQRAAAHRAALLGLRLCRAALYRRVTLCEALGNAVVWDQSYALPNTIRRYSRFKICATFRPPAAR